MRHLHLLLSSTLLASTAWAQPEVYMYTSPVSGNPVDLSVRVTPQVYNLFLIIGNPQNGVAQGTCYLQMSGLTMRIFNTESDPIVEVSSGALGSAATLTSPRCSLNLTASSYTGNTLTLRVSSTAAVGTALPVNAAYRLTSCPQDDGCERYNSAGTWNVQAGTPPPTQAATMTSPVPGTVVSGGSATFTWSAGSGISSYNLLVGTNPGGGDLANLTTTTLSATVGNLPTTGVPLFVRLSSSAGGQWLVNSYTYTASSPVVPIQIVSPAPGSVIPTASPAIQVSTGQNVYGGWTSIGSTAGAAEAYDYVTVASTINVPQVDTAAREIFATVSSGYQGGWLAKSVVYGTSTGGPATSRAAAITFPGSGAVLAGLSTFQWDSGSGVSKYRFTAGSEAGWTNLANVEIPLGTNSFQLNVPWSGRKMFVTLWSLIGQSWLANSYVYDTYFQANAVIPTILTAAQLFPITAPIPGSTYTFQWTPGVGATMYWLSVGSTVDGFDYYDERNIGTQTLSATVRALPANNRRVYVTLYSRLNNVWVPSRSTLDIVERPVGHIPQSFRDCIAADANPAVHGIVCNLPAGTYYMWNTQTTKVISGPSGGFTTLQLNAPIVVARSGITVRGVGAAKIVRYDPDVVLGNPAKGCMPMMEIGTPNGGVSNVTVETLQFEGSAGAYSGYCRPASTSDSQPYAQDVIVQSQTSNVTIRDSEFRNAISHALSIYGSNINGVTISGNRFVEPNLAGILVGNNGVWDGGSPPSYTPQHPICSPPLGAPPAAIADVPRNIVVIWNVFLRSWTGAVALNFSRQVTLQYNSFTDNYQRPYDAGGGTMNTRECNYDTKVYDNTFDTTGLVLPEGNGTIALELNSIKEDVQRNTMRGYPSAVVIARNTRDLKIADNQMHANGRTPTAFRYAAIELWNQYKFRPTTGARIENNTITNPVAPPPLTGTLAYGVRLGTHTCSPVIVADPANQCATDGNQSLMYDIQIVNNSFSSMSVASYCITNATETSNPAWQIQSGGLRGGLCN